MRKCLTALIGAMLLPAAALAQPIPMGTGPGGVVNSENPDGFSNRGQCQSALSREINRQRQTPDERTDSRVNETTSEFQLNMLDRFGCAYSDELDAWVVIVE